MSFETTILVINSVFDAISARRQVRDLARSMGFGLCEQAAISLSAWTVVEKMGIGTQFHGLLTVESVQENGRQGLSFVCSSVNGHLEVSAQELEPARWMVDGLQMHRNGHGLEVCGVKWKE
jgi:hypothetical protein